MGDRRRSCGAVASVSTVSCLRFAPTWVVVSGVGASPVTVTVSWTEATVRVASSGTVPPDGEGHVLLLRAEAGELERDLVVPDGRPLKM